jgi:hypothetical protein
LPSRADDTSSSGDALTSSVIYAGVEATPRDSARRSGNSRDMLETAPAGYRSPSPGRRLGPSLLRQTRPSEALVDASSQSAPGVVVRGRSRVRKLDPAYSSPEDDESNRRGRYRAEEIPTTSAPGYGEGRSGLKHREKERHRRSVPIQ